MELRTGHRVDLVVQDDDGLVEVEGRLHTGSRQGYPIQVNPTNWLGQHHVVLSRFHRELAQQELSPTELEYWAQEWVAKVAMDLTDKLWLVYQKEAGLGTATISGGGDVPGTSRHGG